MHTAADFTSTLFAGLWRASWQAAVLIGLIVLLLRLLRRRLTPPWRHALWLLVLARLLLPATPATSWSLFNWLPSRVVSAPGTEAPATASAPVVGPAGTEVTSGANAALRTPSPGGQEPRPVLPPAAAPVPAPARFAPTAPPAVAAAPGPDGFVAPVLAGETAPRPDAPTAVQTPLGMWLWPGVWLAGVLALAARVVLASVRFRRTLRGGCPVTDEDFAALLADCRQRLRVRRAVEAIETDRVQSPALCGWWRPRLLLPVGLTRRLTRDELRHVLLHELAHLKRGDICVNWLATAAQVLHWFNPAVWYGLRRLRAERELAADHLALTTLGEPQARSYGQTILKLLEGFTQPVAGPAAVGILEGRDAIRERITAVAAFRQPGRWSNLAGLLLVGLGLVALTDARPRAASASPVNPPSAAPVAASPAPPAVPAPGECRLLVVAADTGRPIAGVSVRLQVSDARGNHSFGEYRANREGRVTLDFPPEGITQFTLLVRAPGYALRQEIVPGPRLPRELTLRLEPGVRIGGVVRDDRGQPVAGAQVQVNGVMRDAAGQFVEIELEKVVTDAGGRWTCWSAPLNPAGLNFKLGHSEFFAAEYDQAEEPGEGLVTTRSLLAGEAVMTLQPGIEVMGRVVSGEGDEARAAAEAEVLLASGEGLASRRVTRTDAAGRFRLVALETGEAVVLARARGQAPELRKITLVRGLAPLEFQLQPGRTIEGRVTDERGQPVPGAVVTIERWRDLSLLDWRAETDAEGRFRWETAPLDRVTLAVSKDGYSRTVQEVDAAAGREVTLHLTRTFWFTGRVVDAETGQPVTAFRLVRGDVWGSLEPDHANWEPGRERPISSPDGTFSLGLDYDSGSAVRFMAVAEGYLPEVSPVLAPTGWHEYTFKLKKGEGPQGIVVNAAGQPVAGAEVAIVGMGYLQLARGAFSQLGPKPLGLVKTDSEGRFKLPALLPRPKLLAVHPEHGFAEISAEELAATGRLVLQPWGRIEGVMKIGSKVATNQEVALVNRSMGPGDWHLDFNEYKTRTDAEGRFTIEKAPPGERQLMRPIPIQNGWSWSHRQPLTVKAGEVTRVIYGGTGRPVIGKVVLSDPQRKIEWPGGHHSLSTLFPQPPPDQRTPEGWRAWLQTPEYQQALANHRTYAPTWQPDGSFRFDDVLPGKYQLSLMFMDPGERMPRTSIGSITREVEVPEIPGGQTDEPLDLGVLRLALRSEQEIAAERARQAGSVARSASAVSQVSTLDGGTFDLQQMEGKFVLMTMWSATNEASRAELQMLRELHAEYAGDPRFLMLGEVFDDDPAPARKLVAELGIDWVQLLALADWRHDFFQMYPGVELPASVFSKVGEETKPEPLRGQAVRDAVRKALGEPVKPTEKAAAEEAAEPAPTPQPGTPHSTAAAPVSTAADPGLIVHDSAPPELRGITPRLWAAVFSPDGRTLATTAGWDNPREPGELVLWEVASGRPRVVVRQESTIRTAAFSPDGRRLAIGDFAGQITILDPATGEELLKLPQQTKLVNSVVFTPDGRTLVSGGFDETVRLWDPDTGEARRAFVLPGEGVTTVAVSPNGEWLAAGTWPGKVHLWRLATLEKVREISLKSGRTVEVVSFSPDSALLAVGGWDGEMLLQAVASGADGPRLDRARTGVMSAAFAPDGHTLAIGDDRGTVELWLLPGGTRLRTIPAHGDRCHGLAFAPDGRRLATAAWDRTVKLWNPETRQLVASWSR